MASTSDLIVMRGGPGTAHASMAFRSRLLNACRSSTSSPSTIPKAPESSTSPPAARASVRISSAARSQIPPSSTSVSVSCAGRAKFRKLVTTWESDSVSARMPSTYGR